MSDVVTEQGADTVRVIHFLPYGHPPFAVVAEVTTLEAWKRVDAFIDAHIEMLKKRSASNEEPKP